MMNKTLRILLALFVLGAFPSMLLGQEDAPGDGEEQNVQNPPAVQADQEVPHGKVSSGTGLAIGGACIGAGLAAIGGGYAIARVGGNCIDSMARQPEAAGSMFAPMIVTAAMIEGAMLFAIAVAMVLGLGVLSH
jgi:F-type H+-transporting ATPase subunit c